MKQEKISFLIEQRTISYFFLNVKKLNIYAIQTE